MPSLIQNLILISQIPPSRLNPEPQLTRAQTAVRGYFSQIKNKHLCTSHFPRRLTAIQIFKQIEGMYQKLVNHMNRGDFMTISSITDFFYEQATKNLSGTRYSLTHLQPRIKTFKPSRKRHTLFSKNKMGVPKLDLMPQDLRLNSLKPLLGYSIYALSKLNHSCQALYYPVTKNLNLKRVLQLIKVRNFPAAKKLIAEQPMLLLRADPKDPKGLAYADISRTPYQETWGDVTASLFRRSLLKLFPGTHQERLDEAFRQFMEIEEDRFAAFRNEQKLLQIKIRFARLVIFRFGVNLEVNHPLTLRIGRYQREWLISLTQGWRLPHPATKPGKDPYSTTQGCVSFSPPKGCDLLLMTLTNHPEALRNVKHSWTSQVRLVKQGSAYMLLGWWDPVDKLEIDWLTTNIPKLAANNQLDMNFANIKLDAKMLAELKLLELFPTIGAKPKLVKYQKSFAPLYALIKAEDLVMGKGLGYDFIKPQDEFWPNYEAAATAHEAERAGIIHPTRLVPKPALKFGKTAMRP